MVHFQFLFARKDSRWGFYDICLGTMDFDDVIRLTHSMTIGASFTAVAVRHAGGMGFKTSIRRIAGMTAGARGRYWLGN
jgi:hypothetical protein